jgi:non-canonical purine NTP pyrophosphatase (RdgB/HAM1 family)
MKTPKIVLIATKNKNKFSEIASILTTPGVVFKSLAEFEAIPEVIENGRTFRANALLKARFYFQQISRPVIADDSGLVVPALEGEPGIYSARYAGEKASYSDNNLKLLRRMSGLTGEQRKAHFICQMVYLDQNICISALGLTHGMITDRPRGRSGFGYDPLFYVPELGQTYAELTAEQKNRISHRFRALRNLSRKLSDYRSNTLD